MSHNVCEAKSFVQFVKLEKRPGYLDFCSTPAEERRMKTERSLFTSRSNPVAQTSLFEDPVACYNNLGDKSNLGPLASNSNVLNKHRTSPFTDSDTSGISSDTSALSESYLIDLMVRSLNIYGAFT